VVIEEVIEGFVEGVGAEVEMCSVVVIEAVDVEVILVVVVDIVLNFLGAFGVVIAE
jgi:hypothetical protein